MDVLVWLETKYGGIRHARQPVELPNVGRDTLARWFGIWGFTRGVEVGVERGMYSEVLLRENPLLSLTCVDGWKAYRGYRDHVDQGKLDRFFVETKERLAPFTSRVTFHRAFSLDGVKTFKDGSLDFVYLDGNHDFQNVTNDIAEWSKKVRPGGVIAGHDYVRYRWPNQIQVVQAVNGWTDAHEIRPWFLLGTQAKVDGEVRDTARSFFWVNEPKPVVPRRGKPIKQ